MARDVLGIWLDGEQIAQLVREDESSLRLRYTARALELWPQNSPIVSCSLPLGMRALEALPYFRGLLPEGQTLDAVAARAGLAVTDTFGLLERYGRDVAGALVVSRDAPAELRWDVVPLTDETLTEEVLSLEDHPLGIHDDTELSLAGIQNKLGLVLLADGRWARPLHGRPSTHILKVEDRRWPGLVEFEAACLVLAKRLGLTSITPELRTFDGIPAIIVDRFDRSFADGKIARIHQEDLCQATGIDPSRDGGQAKYQRGEGGGPGFREAASLIDRYALRPTEEMRVLVSILTFTTVIGNADAHGKNVSFVHDSPETIRLAPLYDTVPTIMFPRLRRESAMSVNGGFSYDSVTRDDLAAEASTWPVARREAEAAIAEVLEGVREAASGGAVPNERVAEVVFDRATNLLEGRTAH